MIYLYHSKVQCIGFLMIIMLLYENKYFVEKIEIRKNMLKGLTVSLKEGELPMFNLQNHQLLVVQHPQFRNVMNILFYMNFHLHKTCTKTFLTLLDVLLTVLLSIISWKLKYRKLFSCYHVCIHQLL